MELIDQLTVIKPQFEFGGILSVGNTIDCDCIISDTFTENQIVFQIEQIIHHKVLNIINKSISSSKYYECHIAEYKLKPLHEAPTFNILLDKAKQKIRDSLQNIDITDMPIKFDYTNLMTIENPDKNIYYNGYLQMDTIKQTIYESLKCAFILWYNEQDDEYNIALVYPGTEQSISYHLAKQAITGALCKNEICGISLEPLSIAPFAIVNGCGHIFGPKASNVDKCPTCRTNWRPTYVNITDCS